MTHLSILFWLSTSYPFLLCNCFLSSLKASPKNLLEVTPLMLWHHNVLNPDTSPAIEFGVYIQNCTNLVLSGNKGNAINQILLIPVQSYLTFDVYMEHSEKCHDKY